MPSDLVDIVVIQDIFDSSLAVFLEREAESIARDVNERSLCGRWALYMTDAASQRGLANYYADVEYNRKQGGKVKTIVDKRARITRITCDLILHSRGQKPGADNLIAVEMKKADRDHRERRDDRQRLQAMTMPITDVYSADGTLPEHVCGYRLGAFVLLDVSRESCTIEMFQGGKRVRLRKLSFARGSRGRARVPATHRVDTSHTRETSTQLQDPQPAADA